MSKRGFVYKILDFLQQGAKTSSNLLDIFFSDYVSSYRKAKRMIYDFPESKIDRDFKFRERQRFYALLNKLKNQELIEKRKIGPKSSLWKVTRKGVEKLNLIKEKKFFGKQNINYQKQIDDKIKVIIFDIPEKERYKRVWLRAVLIFLDFKLLQKSVWIGKNKIPEEFISDLRERKILPYVEVFEVTKKGTIT